MLCIEVLSQNICLIAEESEWKGVKVSRSGPTISHICFAYDLILFGEATSSQAIAMEGVLRDFFSQSGQKVNLGKSKLYFSNNVVTNSKDIISTTFGIPITQVLGVYLGMPLLHKPVTIRVYGFLVDKVDKKLSG